LYEEILNVHLFRGSYTLCPVAFMDVKQDQLITAIIYLKFQNKQYAH